MEGISVKPKRAQIMVNVVALGILCGLSLGAPLAGLICAMLTPLFACPLVRHKEEWLGWAAAAAPGVGWLASGWNPAVAAVLLVPGMLPLWITRRLEPKERVGIRGMLLYTCMSILGASAVICVLAQSMGGSLAAVLPDLAVNWLRQSKTPGLILSQLLQAGLAAVPEGFEPSALLDPLLHPFVLEQTLLSFRLSMVLLCRSWLPMLIVHLCVVCGLFTALRIERLNGVMLLVEIDPLRPSQRKTHVTSPPGFRLLAFPRAFLAAMLVLSVLAGMALRQPSGLEYMLALTAYQLSRAYIQLIGAAVMVFVFARRHPDQLTLIGTAVGFVYLFLPTVPLVIGISDFFVHYRTRKAREGSET